MLRREKVLAMDVSNDNETVEACPSVKLISQSQSSVRCQRLSYHRLFKLMM